jgi:hypothetical protein
MQASHARGHAADRDQALNLKGTGGISRVVGG